jgi:hypothetical protein
MRTLVFVLLIILNFSAFGGDGSTSVEDGGHGVKCSVSAHSVDLPATQQHYRVELLDFFEGRSINPFIDGGMEDPIGDWVLRRESRHRLCDRLESVSSKVARVIHSDLLSAALEDSCRLSDQIQIRKTLPATKDIGALTAKINSWRCKIVQIGYRTIENGKEVVLLNEEFLPGLSEQEVAGLLLHESLHKYFPHKISTQAIRQIVFYSFADRRFQVKHRDLILRVISTGIPAHKLEFK